MGKQETQTEMLARRAKIQRLVSMGLRFGYGLYAVASTIFFVGFMTGMTPVVVWLTIACLIIGGAALAPALVFKYGLKAALREERASQQ